MGNFLRCYFWAVALLIVTLVLWGFVLPQAVSARDTATVMLGLFGALIWVGLCGWFIYRKIRKFIKCARY